MTTSIRGIGRPEGGKYRLNGAIVPSVSEILGQYGDSSGLIEWAARLARDGRDHNVERNQAAAFGTAVHEAFEALLYNEDPQRAAAESLGASEHIDEGDVPQLLENADGCIERLGAWIDTYRPEVLATEHPMVSELGYGGTPDLVCVINGRLTVVDLKTSSNVYPRYAWQLAAYGQLWADNFGARPERYSVLHVGKNGKHFEPWVWGDLSEAMGLFLQLVKLHHQGKPAYQDFNRRRVVDMPRRKPGRKAS